MKFSIISIFPKMFDSYLNESILLRARDKGIIDVELFNPRDFTDDPHNKVDDIPYGGGPGMVFKAEPLLRAVHHAVEQGGKQNLKIHILSPAGRVFTNDSARDYSRGVDHLILVCGRYEGIDARVVYALKDDFGAEHVELLSIGNYVLTGGELPAMVVLDAVARQVEGVLGNELSPEENRVASHEVFTRPEVLTWNDKEYHVPDVLLSGHHANIEAWRKEKASPSNDDDANR